MCKPVSVFMSLFYSEIHSQETTEKQILLATNMRVTSDAKSTGRQLPI